MADPEGTSTARRFAANIRTIRERHGWSQEDLARRLRNLGLTSMTQQKVASIENNRRDVPIQEAQVLAEALAVTLDSLIRPAGITRVAAALSRNTALVRSARQESADAAGRYRNACAALRKDLASARGHEEELAEEIAEAKKALKEAR